MEILIGIKGGCDHMPISLSLKFTKEQNNIDPLKLPAIA